MTREVESRVTLAIQSGTGGAPGIAQRMPAIGLDVLTDADLDGLVEFLRSLRTIAP